MSKTKLHYKSDQQSLQFEIHMFIDDLELGLKALDEDQLNIFNNTESPKVDSLVALYIDTHLKVMLNNSKVKPEYLGREISDDLEGIYCYLELEDTVPFESISITNALLLDVYDDQKNITEFKINNKLIKFDMLDEKDKTIEVSL